MEAFWPDIDALYPYIWVKGQMYQSSNVMVVYILYS